MRRLLLIAVLAAGCGSNGRDIVDAKKIDAPVDAPPDGAGSGSNVAATLEPSPRDHGLEVIVVVASMVVVVGPVSRRRRKHGDDDAPRT